MNRIILEDDKRIQSIWLNGRTSGRIEIVASGSTGRFSVFLGENRDFHITYPNDTKIRVS